MQNNTGLTKISELSQKYKYFLFDCDGVLWYGNKHIGVAFRNIEKLEEAGVKVFFVTNSALYSRQSMARKMIGDDFGYTKANPLNLYPSSTLAALHIKQNLPDCKKVHVLGTKQLREELETFGLEVCGDLPVNPDDEGKERRIEDCVKQIDELKVDTEIKAVVQGYDLDVSYPKICLAGLYLQHGATWIITNEDNYTKTEKNKRCPGNGCMANFLGTMLKNPSGQGYICDRVPVGKPNANIVNIIMKEHNIPESDRSKMLMIGDNPGTDIAMGNNAGIDTCLVLTGVAETLEQAQDFSNQDPKNKSTYIMQSMGNEWE